MRKKRAEIDTPQRADESFDTARASSKFSRMPIYVYETTGQTKRRFELKQSMRDAPLTADPETGEPVRRVISGGYGFVQKGSPDSAPSKHSCGSGGCGCH